MHPGKWIRQCDQRRESKHVEYGPLPLHSHSPPSSSTWGAAQQGKSRLVAYTAATVEKIDVEVCQIVNSVLHSAEVPDGTTRPSRTVQSTGFMDITPAGLFVRGIGDWNSVKEYPEVMRLLQDLGPRPWMNFLALARRRTHPSSTLSHARRRSSGTLAQASTSAAERRGVGESPDPRQLALAYAHPSGKGQFGRRCPTGQGPRRVRCRRSHKEACGPTGRLRASRGRPFQVDVAAMNGTLSQCIRLAEVLPKA